MKLWDREMDKPHIDRESYPGFVIEDHEYGHIVVHYAIELERTDQILAGQAIDQISGVAMWDSGFYKFILTLGMAFDQNEIIRRVVEVLNGFRERQ